MADKLRVLVCGGRDFTDRDLVSKTLDTIADEFSLWAEPDRFGNTLPLGLHIISGGADGADSLATDYAMVNWTGYTEFPADWKKHGRAAGPIRNQQMLTEGKPDLVIAFPGGKGALDMARQAKKAGVEVRKVGMW